MYLTNTYGAKSELTGIVISTPMPAVMWNGPSEVDG